MVQAERKWVDDKTKLIIDLKRKACGEGETMVVINQKGIDPLALDLLAKEGILALRRAKRCRATQSPIAHTTPTPSTHLTHTTPHTAHRTPPLTRSTPPAPTRPPPPAQAQHGAHHPRVRRRAGQLDRRHDARGDAPYTPPTHLLHTSCTPPAHLLHTSCTPPAHLLHTSCTPPAHLLHASFTPPGRPLDPSRPLQTPPSI